MVCRLVLQMDSHPLPASRFIPGAASSLAPNPSSTSQILHHTSVGETYGMAQISDETPALIERTGSATHATEECTFLRRMSISLTKVHGPDDGEDPDDFTDMADTTDADAFEILHLGPSDAARAMQETVSIPPPEDSAPPPEDPMPPSIESELNTSEHVPSVIVDRFPNGSPGAPISCAHEGSPMDVTGSGVLGGSIWAPFSSHCDWEFARWAKMRSPTSAAVSDLLSIPEV